MERTRIIFNGVMSLAIRVGFAFLVFRLLHLPFSDALLSPENISREDAGYGIFALLVIVVCTSQIISGLHIFVRGLTGQDVINDPSFLREKGLIRSGVRFWLYLSVLLLRLPRILDYSPIFSSTQRDGLISVPELFGLMWIVLTGLHAFGFVFIVFSRPPAEVGRATSDGGAEASWFDFLSEWLGRRPAWARRRRGPFGGRGSGTGSILADAGGGGGNGGGGGGGDGGGGA